MKKLSIIFFCMPVALTALFDYDRAIVKGQQQEWQHAAQRLNQLVTQQPHRADLLYDAGVAAYKNEDFEHAKAFFEAATQVEDAPRELKEQAYYNKGNAHVDVQELKEGLLAYEQALMLNPDNEVAQHNREIVKKMLEHKEQQEQQKDQDQQNEQNQDQEQQNQDSSCDNQDEQNSQDHSSDDQQDQQQNQDQEQGSDQDQSQDANQDQDKQDSQQQDGNGDSLDQEGNQENEKDGRTDEQEQQSEQEQDRDTGSDLDSSPKEQKQKEQTQQEQEHMPPLDEEQPVENEDMQAEPKEQPIDEQMQQEAPKVPELSAQQEYILDRREAHDAALNKQMIRAQVQKELVGQDGQNCW